LTVSLAARLSASCRAVRYRGSWGACVTCEPDPGSIKQNGVTI
jgi:hypothetical protein